MKAYLIPFFATFCCGCIFPRNTHLQVPIARAMSVGLPPQERRDSLRMPEGAYPRYVDSGRVMQEKHPLYRLEEEANGNPLNGSYSENEAHFRRPERAYEINHRHLLALAEQNAVLEKKVRALESAHRRCMDPRQDRHSQAVEIRSALPGCTPVAAVVSEQNPARSFFLKDALLAPLSAE